MPEKPLFIEGWMYRHSVPTPRVLEMDHQLHCEDGPATGRQTEHLVLCYRVNGNNQHVAISRTGGGVNLSRTAVNGGEKTRAVSVPSELQEVGLCFLIAHNAAQYLSSEAMDCIPQAE
jgi:hypothetical protein